MIPNDQNAFLYPPEAWVRCLLIHPRFASAGYWNYAELCEIMGVKANATPLGLMTVAGILPQHWEFRLVDLNVRDLSDDDWRWADLVAIGGKQPQQNSHLELVCEAKRRHKFVVVGGPNPSAQPELFSDADCLIVGEAESVVPLWLEAWRQGNPRGVFTSSEIADLTTSPTPRFDLIDHRDYLQFNLQYSRGCPYRCDFCDVVAQFGDGHRVKTSAQITAELQRIYDTGYRGPIDIADDNLAGSRRALKREFLPTLIAWSRKHGYPFWFTTEVSLDVADDYELLRLMREADFRMVFTGIETSDEQLLRDAGKKQNVAGSMEQRVRRFQRHGICVTAGFIVGFDGEPPGVDRTMIDFIERVDICLARPSLLIALPRTQLTRRLLSEGRMRPEDAHLVSDAKDRYGTGFVGEGDIVDQTTIGLNFQTRRDKEQILTEFRTIITTLYEPPSYFGRVQRAVRLLRGRQKHVPPLRLVWRQLRALGRLFIRMSRHRSCRGLFWRNLLQMVTLGLGAMDHGIRLMAFYLHLAEYSRLAQDFIGRRQIYEIAFAAGAHAANCNAATNGQTQETESPEVTDGQATISQDVPLIQVGPAEMPIGLTSPS